MTRMGLMGAWMRMMTMMTSEDPSEEVAASPQASTQQRL